jgi:hypothetical protein
MNTTKIFEDSRSPGRDLNFEPSEYEAGVLTTRPRCSVCLCLCVCVCVCLCVHACAFVYVCS